MVARNCPERPNRWEQTWTQLSHVCWRKSHLLPCFHQMAPTPARLRRDFLSDWVMQEQSGLLSASNRDSSNLRTCNRSFRYRINSVIHSRGCHLSCKHPRTLWSDFHSHLPGGSLCQVEEKSLHRSTSVCGSSRSQRAWIANASVRVSLFRTSPCFAGANMGALSPFSPKRS